VENPRYFSFFERLCTAINPGSRTNTKINFHSIPLSVRRLNVAYGVTSICPAASNAHVLLFVSPLVVNIWKSAIQARITPIPQIHHKIT